MIPVVPNRKRVNFYLDADLGEGLKAIKDRDGIPEAEQIRRGIKLWLDAKGYRLKRPSAKRKGGTSRR